MTPVRRGDRRDTAVLRSAADAARQMMDRGGLPGLTPSAAFELCHALGQAATDSSHLSDQQYRHCVALARAIIHHPFR